MHIVGITGGIGSGKSMIAQALRQRGFSVYDCDEEAKRIIVEDEAVRKAIVGLLGEEAYIYHLSSIIYNTTYVAQRVFEDAGLREQLNAIVHPAVEQDIRVKQPDFVESAILYESGLDKLCEKVIVVDAPEEVRLARTIGRDYNGDASPANIDKVRARIKAQGELSIQHSEVSIQDSEVRLIVNNDGKTSVAELADEIQNWLKK